MIIIYNVAMHPETRSCQNCKQNFIIDSDDFAFYEKIQVPAPTFCPECRMIRRFLSRNAIYLYRRPESLTGKDVFSTIPASSPVKVYERDYWLSDQWDALEYGKDFDPKRTFFKQWSELRLNVPEISRQIIDLVRSDYCANATGLKDCYLCFGSSYAENCAYAQNLLNSKDSMDITDAANCELSYGSSAIKKCYRVFFSIYCEDSTDTYFSRDCVGVSNCFGCANLKNKSYCLFNKQLDKEEYEREMAKLWTGSRSDMARALDMAHETWNAMPVRFMRGRPQRWRDRRQYHEFQERQAVI